MFSKKATKIDEIFTDDLTLCSKCQIDGEDFVNFCGLLRKTRTLLRKMYEPNQNFNQKQHNHIQISLKIIGYMSERNFTA